MSLSMHSERIPAGPADAGSLRWVKVAGASILVLGVTFGLLVNRSAAENRARSLRDDPALQAALAPLPEPEAEPVVAAADPNGTRVLFSLRTSAADVPPDPFVPVPMSRAIPRPAVETGERTLSVAPAAAAPVLPNPGATARREEPAAPAVSAADLNLTGLVQGDPPVAVVQYQGQSLFLKIGDLVADSWRLVEIKERSAIFQMGARRVEVPIKGGSSE